MASTAVDPSVRSMSGERLSFAGAAPPSFAKGGVSGPHSAIPLVSRPNAPSTPEALEANMRGAFEQAWTNPGAETRQAFIVAVRARYEVETASIEPADARQRALDHYVAHALAQLPPTS
jgi:hypothetical protein